jgi:hypothetical protein
MYIINVAVAAVMAAPTLTLADVLILTPVDVPTLIPVDALTVAVTMIKLVKMMTIKG